MKNFLSVFTGLAAAAILLTGCPYQSAVPISEPNQKINRDFLGKWATEYNIEASEGGQLGEYYTIEKEDKNVYLITEYTYYEDEDKTEEEIYYGHISEVDGEEFFNITGGMFEDEYGLMRVQWEDKETFILDEVTDNITETFYNSDKLKDFIAEHKHVSFFYNNDEQEVYKKIK